jgi:two-component system OmpR family sensor kinase
VSLRLRLLLALVGLVAVGLIVADGATYVSLQSFLLKRVDQQLAAAPQPMWRILQRANPGLPGNVSTVPAGESADLPPGTYGCLLNPSGQVLAQDALSYSERTPPIPSLPAGLVRTATGNGGQAMLTASAAGHSSVRFRVLATQYEFAPYTLVVAIPLTDVTQTLRRLLLVEGIVTFTVLVGLGLLAWWIVRRELRPLDDMAVTAGAIAAGDLTRRVEHADSRTEVGRLGLALNTMLAQIEAAFARSQNSENALRRFLAQASHELRTPLSSIRGYAELFRRGAKERPEDLDLAMRRIEQEAARMGVLVEELLLLARLDEGRVLDREPVDLTQLAADAVADARIVAPGRDVSLEQSGPVVVSGDESRLRQVVTNLVVNALRHAGDEARVKVSTGVTDGRAVIEVSDDGVGMTSAVAGHVFEPFYRPKDERGQGEATTGLGLSIVAAIAEAHDGDVDLQTAPGQGARFRVRLPLAAPPEAVAPVTSGGGEGRAATSGGDDLPANGPALEQTGAGPPAGKTPPAGDPAGDEPATAAQTDTPADG